MNDELEHVLNDEALALAAGGVVQPPTIHMMNSPTEGYTPPTVTVNQTIYM